MGKNKKQNELCYANIQIRTLKKDENKYLEIQGTGFNPAVWNKRNEYFRRRKIFESRFNRRNKIQGINTWAVHGVIDLAPVQN